MSLSIRPFRNIDPVVVCDLWNSHASRSPAAGHEGWGIALSDFVDPDRMEAFSFSKVFFDAGQLLIAWSGSHPLGFIHLCPVPTGALDRAEVDTLGIAALCVVPGDDEDTVAASLLQAARDYCANAEISKCLFRPALPVCSMYVGLGSGGSLAGTISSEETVHRWLKAAGYKPSIPTTVWELNVSKFRVPADRIQMLVRRRSNVERLLEEPSLPWWQSCVLGHTEVVAYHLNDRVEGRTLQELIFWSLSPELRGAPESVAWIWPPTMDYLPEDSPVEIAPADRLLFLLAESIREMQMEQVDTIRTVTRAEAGEMHSVLSRLGFKASDSGMVFELMLKS